MRKSLLIQFDKLTLISTSPSWWMLHREERVHDGVPDPLSHGEKLRDLLRGILGAHEGTGHLGKLRPGSRRVDTWLDEIQALKWVEDAFDNVWQPAEERLESSRRNAREAYERFVENGAVLFFDVSRLRAAVDFVELKRQWDAFRIHNSPPDHVASPMSILEEIEPSLGNAYLSFRLDWSFAGAAGRGSLAWAPQLVILNYWPESRDLAPEPPADVAPPAPVEPEAAARMLEDRLYRGVHAYFRIFRDLQHGLGSADVGEFSVPVFYFAAPVDPPIDPEAYLSPALVRELTPFGRINMGARDLRSEDISGGVLYGSFLVLRREHEPQRRNIVSDYFLLLPSPLPNETWPEVEFTLCGALDAVAYAHFTARDHTIDLASLITDTQTDLETWEARGIVWDLLLQDVPTLLAEFQRELGSRTRRSRELFIMLNRLQLALTRAHRSVAASADRLVRLDEEVSEGLLEACQRCAAWIRRIPFRPVPHLRRLEEFPTAEGSYPLIEGWLARPRLQGRLRGSEGQASSLLRRIESYRVFADEMLSVERWQEQDRADQNQQRLTYGVAVLTVFTVFPLILGHLDWAELNDALQHSPNFLRWIADPARYIHAWGVGPVLLIGLAVAVSATVLVGIQLVSTFLRREASSGRASLAAAWAIAERASSPRYTTSLRTADSQACLKLLEAAAALSDRRTVDGARAHLRRELDRLVISIEILSNRPDNFRLPKALLLLRYKLAALIVATDWQRPAATAALASDEETRAALTGAGLSEEQAVRLMEAADRASSESVPIFMQLLDREFTAARGARPQSDADAPDTGPTLQAA